MSKIYLEIRSAEKIPFQCHLYRRFYLFRGYYLFFSNFFKYRFFYPLCRSSGLYHSKQLSEIRCRCGRRYRPTGAFRPGERSQSGR